MSLCLVALLVPVPGVSAGESDPEHVPWTEALPPAPADYEPESGSTLCPAGQTRCVDLVISEMQRRFKPLASRCDHDAVFALTYLRTTQEYRRAVSDPAFFEDNAFENHLDVAFADAYFRAYDAWHGRKGAVPPAWQVAFSAADRRSVTGSGNLLLGMSAHVNRDLPFVFEQLGMVAPDGTSRKPDHDRVNLILVRVIDDVLPEAARRFDPAMDDGNIEGTTLDETATFQLLVLWREEAWRNAERLVAARTAAERALVARAIEDSAAVKGRLLAAQLAYLPPLTGPQPRDAWCVEHWNDA